MKRSAVIGLVMALLLGAAGCGSTRSPGATHRGAQAGPRRITLAAEAAAVPQPSARTFVSLLPACGCVRRTELELFSASTGRRIRVIASVPEQPATPAATSRGRLFLTYVRGPRCSRSGYAECPRFVPDSCASHVSTVMPGESGIEPLFKVPGSEYIGQAVPNPNGSEVALMMTPCGRWYTASSHGASGLFVRDLKTGHTRAVVSSSNVCNWYGPTAWNQAGTQLAFLLERALGKPVSDGLAGIACPGGPVYLALAPAAAGFGRGQLKLMRPDRGCAFRTVGFDRLGVVAAEGCDRGQPRSDGEQRLGEAFLIQYGAQDQVVRRVRLESGLGQALISTEPATGDVLVSEDHLVTQGLRPNQPPTEREWVWEFNGHRLRLIARYHDNHAGLGLAVAW